MSEEHHDDASLEAPHDGGEGLHSDHLPHTAPPEEKAVRKSLWRRWMDWSGSFFVISVLVHILIIGGAGVVVVQVVQGRKEKLKFTAPPPAPPSEAVHVKPKKTSAASAPAISKRITSTAANASIALPSMEMNTSSGSDVMASVMSGMGGSGLGAAGMGEGAGGLASMPLAGLTAFGFKGTGRSDGLVGRLYDLKQTKDRQPTDIKDEGLWKNPKDVEGLDFYGKVDFYSKAMKDPTHSKFSPSVLNAARFINRFLAGSWDETQLQAYYRSKDPLIAYQWSIANQSQKDILKAFGVESEVKPLYILIHYKGTVTAPKDCTIRFRCMIRGGFLAVRFDGKSALFATDRSDFIDSKPFQFVDSDPSYDKNKGSGYSGSYAGRWISVQAGKKYPVEMLLSMSSGDTFGCGLMVEEKNPNPPYEPSSWQWQSQQGKQYQTGETAKNPFILLRYPLFALKKGIPSVPFKKPSETPPTNPKSLEEFKHDGWHFMDPDVAKEPMVFPGGGTP
jgi:hypothetical protein